MQWFKSSAVVVSSLVFVAAFAAEGCSSKPSGGPDGGDGSVTKPDSGKVDSGGTQDGGGTTCPSSDPACEVCDVSTYSPAAQVAPLGHANKCPGPDVTAFVTACLSANATQATCTAWQNAEKTSNATCLSCVFTQSTGTNWGPLVCDNNGCKLNVPGCLDLALNQVSQENSTSTGSCGDYLSASYGCQDTACAACTSTDFTTCVNDAVAAECKTYADAFTNASVCASLNGDVEPAGVSNCFPASQSGFTDAEYANFTNFFCGP